VVKVLLNFKISSRELVLGFSLWFGSSFWFHLFWDCMQYIFIQNKKCILMCRFIPSAKISLIRLFNGSIKFDFCSCRITSLQKNHFGLLLVSNKLWKSGINSKSKSVVVLTFMAFYETIWNATFQRFCLCVPPWIQNKHRIGKIMFF
jgi:hypothetical protein